MAGSQPAWQDLITVEDRRALIAIRDYADTAQDTVSIMSSKKEEKEGVRELDIVGRLASGNELLKQLDLRNLSTAGNSAGGQSDFLLLPSKTASSVTLVISGNQAKFSLPHELALGFDTHIVLLRDRRRCFCLAGLSGLGDDYDTCVGNLRTVFESLGVTTCFSLGMSAGGAGALKLGCDLGAAGILGFSIPTTLDLADDPGAELRHYPQLRKLYSLDRRLGIDLAAYYRAKQPRPHLILAYSAGHVRDSWLSERMLGIDGVELYETAGYTGHATFGWLRGEKRLPMLLEKLYASSKTAGNTQSPAAARRHMANMPEAAYADAAQ